MSKVNKKLFYEVGNGILSKYYSVLNIWLSVSER